MGRRRASTSTIIILAFVLAACLAGGLVGLTSRDADSGFISRQAHDAVTKRE